MITLPTNAEIERDEFLVAELRNLGVRHLARLTAAPAFGAFPPVELIMALAAHPQSRLQAALILLFLQRPDYQVHVAEALQRLKQPAGDSLKLYYQAAVYLQRELAASLRTQTSSWQLLRDFFSAPLGLPDADKMAPGDRTADGHLQALGNLHQQHSGRKYNWAGSYRQHIGLFLKHLASDNA